MPSKEKYNKIHIHITYKKPIMEKKPDDFLCAFCLNAGPERNAGIEDNTYRCNQIKHVKLETKAIQTITTFTEDLFTDVLKRIKDKYKEKKYKNKGTNTKKLPKLIRSTTNIISIDSYISKNESIDSRSIQLKSSSIPQMKNELKFKLKNDNSKDTIYEVNRLFANVRRNEKINYEHQPCIRRCKKVLPLSNDSL